MIAVLASVIAILVGLQLDLALRMTVNWDEFYFLSQVYAHARGDLDLALNTIHVHAFGWLAGVPGGEVDQVVAARLVMLALEAASVAFLVGVAGRFVSRPAALCAAIVYLTFSNVVIHGASFRTDPISTFFLMAALWLAVRSRLSLLQAATLGAAIAIAGLVTIKSVFYLPTFAVVAWWRWRTAPEPGSVIRAFAIAAASGAIVFAGLYAWHLSTLAQDQVHSSAAVATDAYRKTMAGGLILPRGAQLVRSLRESPLNWLLIAIGFAIAARQGLQGGQGRWKWVAAAALALPILSVIVYRNAFPYFYVFILPPACVLAAVALERMAKSAAVLAAAVTMLAAGALVQHHFFAQRGQQAQRAVVAVVHAMFPEPVPYIERAGMIASFPNDAFFMSTWGMEKYRAEGHPALRERAAVRPPVFVIASHPALQVALDGVTGPDGVGPGALLPADAAFLRENFIPHWGPIWVAGKALPPSGAGQQAFTIEIPGPYTVEGAPATIDGEPTAPGAVVTLSRGLHRLTANASPVRLRWGDHLSGPSTPPPEGPLYWGF